MRIRPPVVFEEISVVTRGSDVCIGDPQRLLNAPTGPRLRSLYGDPPRISARALPANPHLTTDLQHKVRHIEFINESQLWSLVGVVILLSTILHGFSAGWAMDRLRGD